MSRRDKAFMNRWYEFSLTAIKNYASLLSTASVACGFFRNPSFAASTYSTNSSCSLLSITNVRPIFECKFVIIRISMNRAPAPKIFSSPPWNSTRFSGISFLVTLNLFSMWKYIDCFTDSPREVRASSMAFSKILSNCLDFVANVRAPTKCKFQVAPRGCACNIVVCTFKVNSRFSFICEHRIETRTLLAESSNLVFAAMNSFFHQA